MSVKTKTTKHKYKCELCIFNCDKKILFEQNCPTYCRNETMKAGAGK